MTIARRRSVSTVEARRNFAEILNRAAYGKERVVLARRGRPLVAVVPVEDVALLQEIEDRDDTKEIRARLAEWGRAGRATVSLEDVAKEHGVRLPRTLRRRPKTAGR